MNKKKSLSKLNQAPESDHQTSLGLERLIFFSDAVFAISITLLVLDIHLPAGENLSDDIELFRALSGLWHSYMAYILSFMVIGTFWISHHRKFRFIKRYDGMLILLNLLFLMIVAFVPFPTAVISDYSGRTATIFYALTMLFASLSMAVIWWYASSDSRLIDADMDPKQRRAQFFAPVITAGIFMISIGITFLNPNIAKLSWLLILAASLYANRYTNIKV
jgi:uncharacterized membrane protein